MTLSEPDSLESQGWRPPSLSGGASGGAGGGQENPERVRKRAYDEGFAEGLAAGRAQSEAIAAEMNALLAAMATPFRDADAALVGELVALVERTIGAVLERELESGAYDLQGTLSEALKALGSVSVPVELRMHPTDVALCRELGFPAEPALNVIEDPTLSRGGLRLKAGARVVDASIEARLAEVLASLRDAAGVPDPVATFNDAADPAPESEGS
jgi:flagellar assembly protein FliH